MPISRRDFLSAGAAATAGAVLATPAAASVVTVAERAAPPTPPGAAPLARPAVVASDNGLRGVARAYEMLQRGADPLDAAVEGVKIQELDPSDQSVGLGGLPNAHGVVPFSKINAGLVFVRSSQVREAVERVIDAWDSEHRN